MANGEGKSTSGSNGRVTTIARIFILDDLIRALSLGSAKCSKKYTKTPYTYDAASL